MYMKDWVARLDDYLRMTDSEVLQNAGKVSHALAEQKAKEEYQKYKRLHSGELSRVEQAFLESVEATAKRLEGKYQSKEQTPVCSFFCYILNGKQP